MSIPKCAFSGTLLFVPSYVVVSARKARAELNKEVVFDDGEKSPIRPLGHIGQ